MRALEIAQVSQRKQQAIAMAALAAEKLKSHKKSGSHEFQSDSNLHLIETNVNQSKPPKTIINRRLLFKVYFEARMKNHY